jgi:hypothetical protein
MESANTNHEDKYNEETSTFLCNLIMGTQDVVGSRRAQPPSRLPVMFGVFVSKIKRKL